MDSHEDVSPRLVRPAVDASIAGRRAEVPAPRHVAAREAPAPERHDDPRHEPRTDLGARLRDRLALLETPDDSAYERWYSGVQLGDLARTSYDAHLAQAILVASASMPEVGSAIDAATLDFLRDRRASFAAEVHWVDGRVESLVLLPETPTRTRYATLDADVLQRIFPTRRDSHALKSHLRAELEQRTEDAALTEFARARAEYSRRGQLQLLMT